MLANLQSVLVICDDLDHALLLRSARHVWSFQLHHLPQVNLVQLFPLLLVAGQALALQREPSPFPAYVRVLLLQVTDFVVALGAKTNKRCERVNN